MCESECESVKVNVKVKKDRIDVYGIRCVPQCKMCVLKSVLLI